jgi:phosphatidate cytidylyltransferase
MSNLAARLLTAAVVVPFLLLAIHWSNPIGVWLVVLTATALGLHEFYAMTLADRPRGERAVALIVGLGVAAAVYWLGVDGLALALCLGAATVVAFLYYLFAYGEVESVAHRVAATLAGALYVGVLLAFVALLKRRGADGGAWVIITLTVTWFGDTGAYFAGRFLGPYWPRKLYAAVSPKKTLIGALGGLAGSFGAMALAKSWYLPSVSWVDCALVALPAGALGQMGDLCESLLKRSVGVKDSGALLPGHGGILDRIDALLFCAPYVFFYTRYLYRP